MRKPTKPTTEIPETPTESRSRLGPLPREGVLALLWASYELYCKGAIPELENMYTDPESGTVYMARPNFSDKTITLSIMRGAHSPGERDSEERVYELEQVMRWVHADL